MKEEFLRFLNALIDDASEDILNEYMTAGVKQYIDILNNDQKTARTEITENGKRILDYAQNMIDPATPFKARTAAEVLGVNSRTVSGALRKLVDDGFFDKLGESPVLYTLTEKGKNFEIKE